MSRLGDVYEVFRHRLSGIGPVVIAGGAVRDHLMGLVAKDYDVFVLGTDFETQGGALASPLSNLEQVTPLDFHKSEPFLVGTVKWDGSVIQVMSTPATSVDALLDTFDWNICLFAYDGSIHAKEDIGNVGKGRTLRIHKVTYPLSTLRRGFRFSERYEMPLLKSDVERLCREVLATTIEEPEAA